LFVSGLSFLSEPWSFGFVAELAGRMTKVFCFFQGNEEYEVAQE
jgi:hypothetical protein